MFKRARAKTLCGLLSYQMGVTVATQYKNTPEDVGDSWYFLAALATELVRGARMRGTEIWTPGDNRHLIAASDSSRSRRMLRRRRRKNVVLAGRWRTTTATRW